LKVIIIGAGGNSKVIADLLLQCKKKSGKEINLLGFLDDDPSKTDLMELPILGNVESALQYASDSEVFFINGIGDNLTRKILMERYQTLQYDIAIHPSAIIANNVQIGKGSVVMPGAIINTGTRIGKGVLINSGAIIEHDNQIGDYCHITSGATTAGNVTVGELSMLGTGTKVIQGIKIGQNVMTGAGSVVINDIPDFCLAVGVPAKVIKKDEGK